MSTTTLNNSSAPVEHSSLTFKLLEADLLPDFLIRYGIRRLLAARLREERCVNEELQQQHLMRFIKQLKASPVAINTREANEQHYELPCDFFELVLGKHLKYSSCYFKEGVESLSQAEAEMLALTCKRARITDGDAILELGCGWGSLSLWMAEHFPKARITSVSNSRSQKQFIDARAASRGLKNLEVITCDMNDLSFTSERKFDRVVSVEMFEHMRNYEVLLSRVASWMKPTATLFVHIFTHREYSYPFEVRDESDWMARYFFTGGIMPGDNLLSYFQGDVKLLDHWRVDGVHYKKTSDCWLANMDAHRPRIEAILSATYGQARMKRWWVYWRVFFMSCAELWGYANGREWFVSHYLFENRSAGNR